MNDSMVGEINKLRQMTVAELQVEWLRLYGEPSRSYNRTFLWRRLAWRVQELAHGGLSDRAKARLVELGPADFMRGRTPATVMPAIPDALAPCDPTPRTVRDPRLPSPGTVLTRQYHGRELRLLVLEDGFELDGVRYGSLSEAARAVTGQHWNGRLFFGLTQRKRGA